MRVIYGLIARTCDWFIEWCDYRSDRTWHAIGRFMPNQTAERVNAWLDKRTRNRAEWHGYWK